MEEAARIGGRSVSLNLKLRSEQTKSNIRRPAPHLCGATSAKSFRPYRQATPQLVITRFDVISNFAASSPGNLRRPIVNSLAIDY
jgi:hypothetical protein